MIQSRSFRSNLRVSAIAATVSAALLAPIGISYAGPTGSGGKNGPIGVQGVAEAEIARRMQLVADAFAAVERGDTLKAELDYEGAITEYRAALDLLPDAPMTADQRQIALARYSDTSVELAKQRADNALYADAVKYLESVLAENADHAGAKKLLKEVNDPEIYPVGNTPQHVANVQRVNELLSLGVGYYELGQFDKARETFREVLRIDRYNKAARNNLTKVEQEIALYAKDARSQTRAQMMRDVDLAWETSVPPTKVRDLTQGTTLGEPRSDGKRSINRKLNTIRIPKVQFVDASVQEAVQFLRLRSRELDTLESNPEEKGVNIILKPGAEEQISAPRISLDLTNVPLAEALRYITDLAGLKFKIEPYAVVVVPITDVTDDLYTRNFRVPPTFLETANDGGGGGAELDPFAPAATDDGGGSIKPRKSARQVLEERGVIFPQGASAFFNATTSQLIVRNTQGNLELIEAYVLDILDEVQRQIHITTKFVEVTQRNREELGFDWMLGPFNVGGERTFGSGGVPGYAGGNVAGDFPTNLPGSAGAVPVGVNPVSRGLRFGNDAIPVDTIDDLIASQSSGGAGGATDLSPGVFGISGVFTDPQFQVLIRSLAQRKGVDLMSAPSVVTRSGQRAKIEVIREFIYPIEYDPPEIPNQVGGDTIVGGDDNDSGTFSTFPVTPATPTTFETRNVGVTVDVDPVIGPDGFTIDLNLSPEVVEFEGFINYGSPIQSAGVDGTGEVATIVLTENRIDQPIFATRRVTTSVTIWDGQTVAIGGLMREDVDTVEDKIPFLGDLPGIGRLFQTQADQYFKRNLMVFVTARLIDPSGQPIRSHEELVGQQAPTFTP